jgi:diadenosine tetraphosphate (Ap4A) HIT family hydrolase
MATLIRHWDPERQFEGAVLNVYEHWSLEVSWQQHTLGCYILFCRREGVRLMSELEIEEFADLRMAMRHIEEALRRKDGDFRADHFNYWQMGNALPQLHVHGIPRYNGPRSLSRELLGRDVTDSNPGHIPPWSREHISSEQMKKLRDRMAHKLPRENPFYKWIRKAMKSW